VNPFDPSDPSTTGQRLELQVGQGFVPDAFDRLGGEALANLLAEALQEPTIQERCNQIPQAPKA
jgi:hypothetical protein